MRGKLKGQVCNTITGHLIDLEGELHIIEQFINNLITV